MKENKLVKLQDILIIWNNLLKLVENRVWAIVFQKLFT